MYKQIMVPVDLDHVDHLQKCLRIAADLSKHYNAPICYVGVTMSAPSDLADSPEAFQKKLETFANEQSDVFSHQTSAKSFISLDLPTDVDDVLLKAVSEVEADLVVMASHVPSIIDYIWPSNGGKIAAHSAASVFVVR